MKIDGFDARRATHLTWRSGDPEIDKDIDGKPVESNYVVIVRLKDCPVVDHNEHGHPIVSSKGVPGIPLGYRATYSGYGKWHKRKAAYNQRGLVDEHGKEHREYWTVPAYFVRDGRVYTATHRMPYLPLGAAIRDIKRDAGEHGSYAEDVAYLLRGYDALLEWYKARRQLQVLVPVDDETFNLKFEYVTHAYYYYNQEALEKFDDAIASLEESLQFAAEELYEAVVK